MVKIGEVSLRERIHMKIKRSQRLKKGEMNGGECVSNFKFFDGTWASAAKVAQKAEQIIYQDPSGALQHLRKFGVIVAKNIIEE